MQRYLTSLLVMMLYLASSTSSAQQFESFRHVGAAGGIAAGTVTSITLAPTTSQISYFNVAGLSTIYDVALSPSSVIRDNMPAFMPTADFGEIESSMNLTGVDFYTGTLINTQDTEADVPAHWFRITQYDGTWSGTFRIADRIYTIDRSQRDNIVEVRQTPSQNTRLLPTRQIKLTALIDEEFVFADSPGDSIGMDSLGHIYALEAIHVMDGLLNDSLGMTIRLGQLIYQPSNTLASPAEWIDNNTEAFGLEDSYATLVFRGDETIESAVGDFYTVQNKSNFHPLSTAHQFGKLLGITEESGTLQSSQNPLDAAHWSDTQKALLLENLPNNALVQIISSDAPVIEVTEPEIINEIPQYILDSEIVETAPDDVATGDGLLLGDAQTDLTPTTDPTTINSGGGGGTFGGAVLSLLLLSATTRRRRTAFTTA